MKMKLNKFNKIAKICLYHHVKLINIKVCNKIKIAINIIRQFF